MKFQMRIKKQNPLKSHRLLLLGLGVVVPKKETIKFFERILMEIVGWIIWGIACLFCCGTGFGALYVEVFKLNPFPYGPERRLSPNARKVFACLTILVDIAGLTITAVTDISKLHLLWFIPLNMLLSSVWYQWKYVQPQTAQAHRNTKISLRPKKVIGPDSRLKKYPFLYLYFDNFSEIAIAWKEEAICLLLLADNYPERREQIYEITGFFDHPSDKEMLNPMNNENLDKIMADEDVFLQLYEAELLKLKLWNGETLCRTDGNYYWDRIIHPDEYTDKSPSTRYNNPYFNDFATRTNDKLTAIKLRYGLTG